jgi:hypothetical protein
MSLLTELIYLVTFFYKDFAPLELENTCFLQGRFRACGLRDFPASRRHAAGTVTIRSPATLILNGNTGRSRLAGPWVTFPSGANVEPWHLQ